MANSSQLDPRIRAALQRGLVIPACPLALNPQRQFDERRQRGLFRYYAAAGAGGVAVGVHTTQFAIREPQHNLFRPLLELGSETMDVADGQRREPLVRTAGICGRTKQAVAEATLARDCRYNVGLLSLVAMKEARDDELIAHCKEVAQIVPLCGFYLQPAVGGRNLAISFWRAFAEIENVVAIKIAPFDRYATLDVMRAVAESGRDDIALYTGNDDNIVADLLTTYRFHVNGRIVERRMVGGLLGHWSVWTRSAVELLQRCHQAVSQRSIPADLLRLHVEVTDANAAFFDAANGFRGCIAGLHEVLRRQGLLETIACLDPNEGLSLGQAEEISRIYNDYPHLHDNAFVHAHLAEWLAS
jgi:hypothetical protein